MTLKDLLKKKEKIRDEGGFPPFPAGPTLSPDVPEFTFMRTTTSSQSIIEPPSHPLDPVRQPPLLSPTSPQGKLGRFRRHSHTTETTQKTEDPHEKSEHKLSGIFGRNRSASSANIPENLPDIVAGVARTEDDEAQWEKRATIMAKGNTISQNTTPNYERADPMQGSGNKSKRVSVGSPSDEVWSHKRRRVG
jgi:hypothetical protein